MAMIQLTGGPIACPDGALELQLTTRSGAELALVDALGNPVEPAFRATRSQVVVLPGQPVIVIARPIEGNAFVEGTRIGVTVKAASGSGDEVVRPPVDAGGRTAISLVEIADGQITDLVGQTSLTELAWMQRGSQAFHTNHAQRAGHATKWACVLDGSAMSQHTADENAYRQFLELVLGTAATAYGCAPSAWWVATQPPRDVTASLEHDEIAWEQALSHAPAPWPNVGEAVEAACAGLPNDAPLLIICDGVFVDYREVRDAIAGRESIVVALGRSKYGVRVEDRPTQFWEEELDAFDGFHRVVSLASLTGLSEAGPALADALFPRSQA